MVQRVASHKNKTTLLAYSWFQINIIPFIWGSEELQWQYSQRSHYNMQFYIKNTHFVFNVLSDFISLMKHSFYILWRWALFFRLYF
jgi:hypothetical protein